MPCTASISAQRYLVLGPYKVANVAHARSICRFQRPAFFDELPAGIGHVILLWTVRVLAFEQFQHHENIVTEIMVWNLPGKCLRSVVSADSSRIECICAPEASSSRMNRCRWRRLYGVFYQVNRRDISLEQPIVQSNREKSWRWRTPALLQLWQGQNHSVVRHPGS